MTSVFPELVIHKSISTPSVSQLSETSPADSINETSPFKTTYLPSPRRFINNKKSKQGFTAVKTQTQFKEISHKLSQYEKAFQLILQRSLMLPNNELSKIINEYILPDFDSKDLKPMYKPAIAQFKEEKNRESPKQILMCLLPKNNSKDWKSYIIKEEVNINQLTRQELCRVQINEVSEQEENTSFSAEDKKYSW